MLPLWLLPDRKDTNTLAQAFSISIVSKLS